MVGWCFRHRDADIGVVDLPMLVARHTLETQLLQRGYRAGIDERTGILDDLPQRLSTAFEFVARLVGRKHIA